MSLIIEKQDSESATSSADWVLDPQEFKAMFNPKTKAIIFNNPNNPLGKVYQKHEIEMVADCCKKHNVLVISDDVYEHMVLKNVFPYLNLVFCIQQFLLYNV